MNHFSVTLLLCALELTRNAHSSFSALFFSTPETSRGKKLPSLKAKKFLEAFATELLLPEFICLCYRDLVVYYFARLYQLIISDYQHR